MQLKILTHTGIAGVVELTKCFQNFVTIKEFLLRGSVEPTVIVLSVRHFVQCGDGVKKLQSMEEI